MNTVIYTKNAPEPIGPYKQAILAGNTLYVSGQIPINPATNELISDSYAKATEQVMQNIQAILQAASMSFDNVVRCTIFVADLAHFGEVNEMYGTFFGAISPSRECVQVAALPKGALVEISAIAVK
ncbi:MAG: RidA family protein [Bacteroidales bacterium]|jgi:2-iminobutanoate/2-iminopropanoate deaminase|nr:RidA family protein [Bacteroidales bacterium]